VKGRVELPLDEQGRYRRRIVTIHGKSVVGFSVAVRRVVRWVQRLAAITESRDFSQLTFHNHIPIAQRLQRRLLTYLNQSSRVKKTPGMWDGECESG
jgi:hypothetical protein